MVRTTDREIIYKMSEAVLDKNEHIFSDLDFNRAMRDGFFQIKVGQDILKHLDVLDRFSNEFYKDKQHDLTDEDRFRGFNRSFNERHEFARNAVEEGFMVDNHKGLGDTNENQNERFGLKKTPGINHWKDFYPDEVEAAAEVLNDIGIIVLKEILRRLNIDSDLWEKATGGAVSNKGAHYLVFNHYRPDVQARGLKAHQDWGNVGILRVKNARHKRALEAYINQQWMRIVPDSDEHLIVNMGIALELFTQHLPEQDRVTASVHRVIQQENDRTSYVLFLDHALSEQIVQLTHDKTELKVVHESYGEFVSYASRLTFDGIDTQWEAIANGAAGAAS